VIALVTSHNDKRKTGEERRKALKLGVMTCRSPTHNPRRTHLAPFQGRLSRNTFAHQTNQALFSARASNRLGAVILVVCIPVQQPHRASNNATHIPTQTKVFATETCSSGFLCYIAKACIYTTATKHTYHIIPLPA